ncbi:MAG: autotransporter outer membrane beta-barrel domain-containing protein [Rhodobacteraceae bacterium]|nr:autotransporter outer membrane beta-barrel domain-containing protein [Paracoccaceae bacterium]
MNLKTLKLQTCAPLAICTLIGTSAFAGSFDTVPVIDVTGDGYVFADPAEGVLEPGIQSFTEEPGAEYSNTGNPNGILNCLMAYNPDLEGCDAPRGSGKRIKTRLTGSDGMDIRLSTQSTGDVTEYYVFGKTSNLTGARMLGFQFELGTGSGSDFVAFDTTDPTYAALFDVEFTDGKFNLPDGLFGDGGNESDTGFFDATSAVMSTDQLTAALIELGAISSSSTYTDLFGDGFLDDTQVPDGFFFDMSSYDETADEPALIAWYNVSAGAWVYGNVDADAITALETELGMSVGYSAESELSDEVVAAMQANGLISVDIIEDLRNMNLNFMIELGDVDGNEVTLRLVPVFSDIVNETYTEYQFKVAGMLDGAAEIPYLDLGNAALYQAAVDEILALDEADQLAALESVGFSFLGSYNSLSYELGRAMTAAMPEGGVNRSSSGATLSTKGMPNGWLLGENVSGFVTARGGAASYDRTTNGTGYDVDTYAFAAGAEWQLDPTLSFGVMVGGGTGKADAQSGLGSVDADALSIAVFGRKAFGEGGSISAVLGYQDLSFDSTRNVLDETAVGETDGSQIFAALKAKYLFQNGAFTYGPRASVEYFKQKVDGFEETGAGAWNLAIGDQDGDVVIASVGIMGEYALPQSTQETLLTGALSLTSTSGDDQLIETGFVGLPSTTVPVDGFDNQWIDLELGFSSVLSATSAAQTTLRGGYHGSFGDDYESHALQLSVNFQF